MHNDEHKSYYSSNSPNKLISLNFCQYKLLPYPKIYHNHYLRFLTLKP
nr:MAG TPA: hypothetical protein [Caudoviricetes sp.]